MIQNSKLLCPICDINLYVEISLAPNSAEQRLSYRCTNLDFEMEINYIYDKATIETTFIRIHSDLAIKSFHSQNKTFYGNFYSFQSFDAISKDPKFHEIPFLDLFKISKQKLNAFRIL